MDALATITDDVTPPPEGSVKPAAAAEHQTPPLVAAEVTAAVPTPATAELHLPESPAPQYAGHGLHTASSFGAASGDDAAFAAAEAEATAAGPAAVPPLQTDETLQAAEVPQKEV